MGLMDIFNKRKYRELYDLGLSKELINGLLANTRFKSVYAYEVFKDGYLIERLQTADMEKVQTAV